MGVQLRWLVGVFAVAVLAGAGALSATAYTAEGSFERSLRVTGPVELDIETRAGSITVRAGEAGRVRVRGIIRARTGSGVTRREAEEKVRRLEAEPPIEQEGNVIRIGNAEERDLRQNVSISYELLVPEETRVRARTGSGSQSIEGIRGPVEVETGSGSIKISEVGGEVRAQTGSGRIELDSVNGAVTARTGSGSIRATGIAGGFVASTGSGNVELVQTASGEVRVKTGSGSVEVRGVSGPLRVVTGSGRIGAQGEPIGDWRLRTGVGSVRVTLPSEAAFDLRAHTGSGQVYSEYPLTLRGSLGRRTVEGKVRGGGFLVELETGSGNIHIE